MERSSVRLLYRSCIEAADHPISNSNDRQSAVSTRQPETGAKVSKCSGHFFSPQKSPQNSRPRVPFNDLRCRPCVPSHCKYVLAKPEKAGVGGSTPSLATTFQST